MRNPFKTSNALVGLDIGSTSIKLVELSRHGDRHRLRHRLETFGVEPLPPAAVVGRNISDPERVGEAIRRLVRRIRCRTARAATAVPDAMAISKTIEMDASLSDDAMLGRIVDQAERHIPFPLADVAMDFEVRNLSERNPDQVEVLLAACRREDVERREAAMRLGGLRPQVVEIEGHAMHRALAVARSPVEAAPSGLLGPGLFGVVDIGAAATRLQVSDPSGPIYFREQRFGGHHVGDDPFRGEADEVGDADGTGTALVPEICRAVHLFSASHGHAVDGLVLAGHGALVEGLAPALADALVTPVHLAAPFTAMSLGPRVDPDTLASSAPGLLTACGLALRALARNADR